MERMNKTKSRLSLQHQVKGRQNTCRKQTDVALHHALRGFALSITDETCSHGSSQGPHAGAVSSELPETGITRCHWLHARWFSPTKTGLIKRCFYYTETLTDGQIN